jgi:hypothetical protein
MIKGRDNLLKFYTNVGQEPVNRLSWRMWTGLTKSGSKLCSSSGATFSDNYAQLKNTLEYLAPGQYSIKFIHHIDDEDKAERYWASADGTSFEITQEEAATYSNQPGQPNSPAIGNPYGVGSQRMYTKEEMNEYLDKEIRIMKLEHKIDEKEKESGLEKIATIAAPIIEIWAKNQQLAQVAGPPKNGIYISPDQPDQPGGTSGNNGTAAAEDVTEQLNARVDDCINTLVTQVFNNDYAATVAALEKLTAGLKKDPSKVNLLNFL